MRFHSSIRRPGGMTKRQTVLQLMRIAGYENDRGKWMRLLIENPIRKTDAEKYWQLGTVQRHAAKKDIAS